MSILSNAVSGLNAYQRALATVSNNIANVNTEGYSRQVVEFSSNSPELVAGSYNGRGVNISGISRVYDQHLFDRVTSSTSSFEQANSYLQATQQLDATLGEPSTSLAGPLQSFFNAIQDVASNPTSIPARQVVISEGAVIADRFNNLDQQLDDMQQNINNQLSVAVTQINTIAESIKDLNKEIVVASGAGGGTGLPNELFDERDRLVLELSKFTNVSTTVSDDHSMSVYIGSGQALVIGSEANKLAISVDSFDASDRQISLVVAGQGSSITNQLSGGIIGGLYAVKSEIVEPSLNALGRIALDIASAMNTLHQNGTDMNGNSGGLFFNDVISSAPEVLPNSANNSTSGTVSIAISDVSALEISDYQLNYDGTNFSLTRLSDNTVIDSGFATTDLPRTVSGEGFVVSLSGSLSAGDKFIIRPTRSAAGKISMQLSDPSGFAAAENGAAVGNNVNALAMAALQSSKGLANNSMSYQDAFSSLVAQVAVNTNRTSSIHKSQEVLLNQALEAHSGVSGVNLDEEAANLLRFQQAYQASARMISAADDIFQSLLAAVQ